MDNRPIGIFDSGIGGLTTVRKFKKTLPEEKVIYYGDTARTPYGSKTAETIVKFATQITDYLIERDCKMIIIACNTVTATALDTLRERHPSIPIIGVIEPTVRKAAQTTGDKLAVIATKATIRSDIYGKELKGLRPDLEVFSKECPAIVPLIEEGFVDTEIMELTIKHYLDEFVSEHGFTDMILGCTHYPLVKGMIGKLYPELRLYDSSSEVVKEAERILSERDTLASGNEPTDCYYASDLSESFLTMMDLMFKDTDFKIQFLKLEE